MSTQALEPALELRPRKRITLATVGFRFAVVYFTLYCVLGDVGSTFIPVPDQDTPDLNTLWPFRLMVLWPATHLLGLAAPPSYALTGSGDRAFDWVFSLVLLVISGFATALWCVLDRGRPSNATVAKWFRLFIRLSLASTMISYGAAKLIPSQMPAPYDSDLFMRFGDQSPMGLLWKFIGASPAYEMFAGSAELLGGILLLLPSTTTLGALICLAAVTHVFVLNMSYDVPVKLFSFHLILLSLVLLAPEFPRLVDFLLLNRPTNPSASQRLFATPRANRYAAAAQVVFGACLLVLNLYGARSAWYAFGEGRPKPLLSGMWDVERVLVDGQVQPPVASDGDRWRRVFFDSRGLATVQGHG